MKIVALLLGAYLASVTAHPFATERTRNLFRREEAPNPNRQYPSEDVFGPAPRQEWIDAYNQAKAAGLIPSVAPSRNNNGNIAYASGVDQGASGLCSWTTAKCFGSNDIHEAPTSMVGISFDDGPQRPSKVLLDFLKANNQTATHFMIGSRILDNPDLFAQAIANGDHIASHTWAHPYMTTLDDMGVLGELGWVMQIIYDHSGLIPAYWRPPYGDIDNRVRAIAENVFGLIAVIWDHDSNDWCLTDDNPHGSDCSAGLGPTSDADLANELTGFAKSAKNPGLIILEHELSSRTVKGFMNFYPQLLSNGWIPKTIPDLFSYPWYQNNVQGNANPSSGSFVGNHLVNHAIVPTSAIASPTVNPVTASVSAPTNHNDAPPTPSANASSASQSANILTTKTSIPVWAIVVACVGAALVLVVILSIIAFRYRWFGGKRDKSALSTPASMSTPTFPRQPSVVYNGVYHPGTMTSVYRPSRNSLAAQNDSEASLTGARPVQNANGSAF